MELLLKQLQRFRFFTLMLLVHGDYELEEGYEDSWSSTPEVGPERVPFMRDVCFLVALLLNLLRCLVRSVTSLISNPLKV